MQRRSRLPRLLLLCALGWLAAPAFVSGCASGSPERAPVPEQTWQWPAGQGKPPDLASDRAKCEYEAAEFKAKYPDLYRITVNKCIEQRGWVPVQASAGEEGDR